MTTAKPMPATWKRKRTAERKLQLAVVKAVEAYLPQLEARAERAIAVRCSTLTTRNEFQAVDERLTRAVEVLQQHVDTLQQQMSGVARNLGGVLSTVDRILNNRTAATERMDRPSLDGYTTSELLDELRRRFDE